MAQVRPEVQQQVDWMLERSLAAWRGLPEVEAEIDGWDQIDQIVFIEEWPIEENHLTALERYASQGALTPDQMARYGELKRVVERNHPIIRRLQES